MGNDVWSRYEAVVVERAELRERVDLLVDRAVSLEETVERVEETAAELRGWLKEERTARKVAEGQADCHLGALREERLRAGGLSEELGKEREETQHLAQMLRLAKKTRDGNLANLAETNQTIERLQVDFAEAMEAAAEGCGVEGCEQRRGLSRPGKVLAEARQEIERLKAELAEARTERDGALLALRRCSRKRLEEAAGPSLAERCEAAVLGGRGAGGYVVFLNDDGATETFSVEILDGESGEVVAVGGSQPAISACWLPLYRALREALPGVLADVEGV